MQPFVAVIGVVVARDGVTTGHQQLAVFGVGANGLGQVTHESRNAAKTRSVPRATTVRVHTAVGAAMTASACSANA
jgi:hypothetical protein